VDLIYYGSQKQLEYDLVLAPGADPEQVRFRLEGADRLTVDGEGALVAQAGDAEMRQLRPEVYQVVDGARRPVRGEYTLLAKNEVGFTLGEYDRTAPLVIDPIIPEIQYSGFSGYVLDDAASGVALAPMPTGHPNPALPYPNPDETLRGVAYVAGSYVNGAFNDAFVMVISPTGATVRKDVFGGSGSDQAIDIAVDGQGAAYVTGTTTSTDLVGAFTPTHDNSLGGSSDAFVVKFNRAGVLVYKTYLGGNSVDLGGGIAVDPTGNAYVVGDTFSPAGLPVSASAYDTTHNGNRDFFLAKLSLSGGALTIPYCTYLGGTALERTSESGNSIDVDAAGRAWITGWTASSLAAAELPNALDTTLDGVLDAYVACVDTSLTGAASLLFATYLGGTGTDLAHAIALDPDPTKSGIYLTGSTDSTEASFPVTPGSFGTVHGGNTDAFVIKLDRNTGTGAVTQLYGGFIGGSGGDRGLGIDVDSASDAVVTGVTTSATGFRLERPIDGTLDGTEDLFVAKIQEPGSAFIFSDYLGGSGADRGLDVAVDCGDAYLTGYTDAGGFATAASFGTSVGGGKDAFAVKIALKRPDTTPPSCRLISNTGGTAVVEVQDLPAVPTDPDSTAAGLKKIVVLSSSNCRITWPNFVTGNTAPLQITATKINPATRASFMLAIHDCAGYVTTCDPVITTLRIPKGSRRVTRTFRGLPAMEHYITLENGTPGIDMAAFRINGRAAARLDLQSGEKQTLDVAEQMNRRTNTVTVTATGAPGSTALLVIGDASTAGGAHTHAASIGRGNLEWGR
ncbi:MAG: putative secreted protein, partial [Armatimonadetes bacterium]|nr:putative secreted protein [Armatimonadota bacterium]